MDDYEVRFPGQLVNLLEELDIYDLRRRVIRERYHEHFRLRPRLPDCLLYAFQKARLHRERHAVNVAPRYYHRVYVYRISRVRHDNCIPRRQYRLHQVAYAFLRAYSDHNLAVRVELDAVASLVPVRDRAAELRYARRSRIPVRPRIGRRLYELVDYMLGRRLVGVAHSEVDYVFSPCPGLRLEVVHDSENIGREPSYE